MTRHLRNFIHDEDGQDLIEYTLLLAFIGLGAVAMMTGAGRNVKGIWQVANSTLTAANTAVS